MKLSVCLFAAVLMTAAPVLYSAEPLCCKSKDIARITYGGVSEDGTRPLLSVTVNGLSVDDDGYVVGRRPVPPSAIDGTIGYAAARALSDEGALLLDVRTSDEYMACHADRAELLPLEDLEKNFAKRYPDRGRTIIFYCRSGRRSGQAMKTAQKLGYGRVYNLGSYKNWKGSFKGTDVPMNDKGTSCR